MKINEVTDTLDQLSKVLQPYTGTSLAAKAAASRSKEYVAVKSTYTDKNGKTYTKTQDGWVDATGKVLPTVYQSSLDKLWVNRAEEIRKASRTTKPIVNVTEPELAQPTVPGALTLPNTPGAPTAPSPPNPIVYNITTKSGAKVVKRADGKWYDPSNRVITDPATIQSYEKSPQLISQRQTRSMAAGQSSAKTAALAPTKRPGQSFVTYSKPPQRKKGRSR